MCEAHAFLIKGGQEEKVFENVDRVEINEQEILNARIKELALVDHKIILEEINI